MEYKFTPTYLYIKQHSITGKLYFGKTTRKNPISYLGSGKYWKRHLKIHGNSVITLWHELFTNAAELAEFAIKFSTEMNIVRSDQWANLKNENGFDGGSDKGIPKSKEHYEKIRMSNIGRPKSNDTKLKISASLKGRPLPIEVRQKMKESKKKNTNAAKSFILEKDGKKIEVRNLKQFCLNNEISYRRLQRGRVVDGYIIFASDHL